MTARRKKGSDKNIYKSTNFKYKRKIMQHKRNPSVTFPVTLDDVYCTPSHYF